MRAWLSQHRNAAALAWRRLVATPVNSLLFLLAVGVALALPAGGQMLLANALHVAGAGPAAPPTFVIYTGGGAGRPGPGRVAPARSWAIDGTRRGAAPSPPGFHPQR